MASARAIERWFPAAVAALGCLLLLGVPERLWAFAHLADLPRGLRWAAAGLVAGSAVPRARAWVWQALERLGSLAGRTLAVAGSAACLITFWLLRQRNFELGDSSLLIQLLTRFVHLRGFHVTYDEPLELYLHSVAYRFLHASLDWPVEDAYALLSVLAGVAAVLVVAALWREAAPTPGRRALAVALTLSTPAVQLFFGYVENYTLVAAGMLLYVLLAWRCLAGRCRLVWPALALGWSLCLHVLAGWLFPSLLYLALVVRRQRGASGVSTLLSLAAGVLTPVALTIGWLTAIGVPTAMLGKTHLAHFKFVFLTEPGTPQYQFAFLSAAHLAAQANQLLLVGLPGLLLVAGVFLCARRETPTGDPFLRLLAVAALSLQVFASTWNPELGAYKDWDLFAVAGFFLVLLGAYPLIRLQGDERVRAVALPVLALSVVLTASWVTSNARRTVAVDALHDDAHFRAAVAHEKAGRTDAAAHDLQEALRINPRNGPATLAYADVLRRQGELARAAEVLEAYLALEPRGPAADQARRLATSLESATID